MRSLLCTSTNQTPHERLSNFTRRSSNGQGLPSWLIHSEKALLKRFIRKSKYDPLVDEVELIDVKTSYARIRHADGREDTVSTKHLAPLRENSPLEKSAGEIEPSPLHANENSKPDDPVAADQQTFTEIFDTVHENTVESVSVDTEVQSPQKAASDVPSKRPERARKPPSRYGEWEF